MKKCKLHKCCFLLQILNIKPAKTEFKSKFNNLKYKHKNHNSYIINNKVIRQNLPFPYFPDRLVLMPIYQRC